VYVPEHVDDSWSKLKETEKEKNVIENCVIIKPYTDKHLGFILNEILLRSHNHSELQET
jgi:hypothetical protein